MTNLAEFPDEEFHQILDAPGAVLKAASLADGKPGPIRFIREAAAGAKVFREAQVHENDFVQSVAIALRDRISEQRSEAADARANPAASVGVAGAAAATEQAAQQGARPDPAGEAARAVELTGASIAVLRERADAADVEAYGQWLIRIAVRVAGATGSKKGGLFSKQVKVDDGEQDLIERLTAAVEG